jgi:hypothetical protein
MKQNNNDNKIPAEPPSDYKGNLGDWVRALRQLGYWKGRGYHGNVLLELEQWNEVLALAESGFVSQETKR